MTHAPLHIAIAQLNFWVGDIAGNTQKIIHAIHEARDKLQADIIIFPELALCGYPPEDLLLRADFHQQCQQALKEIAQQVKNIDVVLGHPQRISPLPQGEREYLHYNAASIIRDQKILATYHKQYLPNYGVFDEMRYFASGNMPCLFDLKGIPTGIIICEDMWHPKPMAQAKQAGAQLIICINASPFDIQKAEERIYFAKQRIAENALPIIYAHGVSGQDDLVFDGGSFVMDTEGEVVLQEEFFMEKLINFPLFPPSSGLRPLTRPAATLSHEERGNNVERAYRALVLAVRDYINKNNFPGVLIGVSGGIDSALTLAIAVDALGKERVEAVLLPSRYTSEFSMQLATTIAQNFDVKTTIISIENGFAGFLASFTQEGEEEGTVVNQNLQSRCRGVIMMALSNRSGKLVLTTGNKSEMAVGYATLYGDMAGGFAVLKDVPKTLVYELSHYRNALDPLIPAEIIQRAPTAELAPNQTDEDTLPPYAILDPIIELYVERDYSAASIIAAGFAAETVRKVIAMIDRSEYKRRQAAPGPRITRRSFSRERRYPITSQYKS